MKERESLIIGSLTVFMLVLWLGFLAHSSSRFAGSFAGGMLAISGSAFMMIPFAYVFAKRIKWLKTRITKFISMRSLLTIHIYAGILGPILVLLHTGHKFESTLGITLTAMTIVVVISGYIGRYLLKYISTEVREKKILLTNAQDMYQQTMVELQSHPNQQSAIRSFTGMLSRFFISIEKEPGFAVPVEVRAVRLSESIADLEYAIKSHETFKGWFGKWLKIHFAISWILFGLLAMHVWGAIHFGLRWSDSWAPTTLYSQYQPAITSDDAPEKFSNAFARLYKRHWRPDVTIHGYRTTVFNYAGLAQESQTPRSDFNLAVAALSRVNPHGFKNKDQQKAFWINVYNFAAMKLVSEPYPVNSITDKKISWRGDPWGLDAVEIGGKKYGLRQIEKEILLGQFKDPRIIFAVSCAAVSCPDRTDSIFYGQNLDNQLDDMIRNLFANPTKGLKVQKIENKITLSWILKADKDLFDGKKNPTLIDFVLKYAPTKYTAWLKANQNKLKIEFFEHDWTLNDTAQADAIKTENKRG